MALKDLTPEQHDAEMAAYRSQAASAAKQGFAVVQNNSDAFDAVMGGAYTVDAEGRTVLTGGGDPEMDLRRYFDKSSSAFRERNKAYADDARAKLLESTQKLQPATPVESSPDRDVELQREHNRLTAELQEIESQFSWNQTAEDEAA